MPMEYRLLGTRSYVVIKLQVEVILVMFLVGTL